MVGKRPEADRARVELERRAKEREKIPKLAANTHRVRGFFVFREAQAAQRRFSNDRQHGSKCN
jgi:hypothetical protein